MSLQKKVFGRPRKEVYVTPKEGSWKTKERSLCHSKRRFLEDQGKKFVEPFHAIIKDHQGEKHQAALPTSFSSSLPASNFCSSCSSDSFKYCVVFDNLELRCSYTSAYSTSSEFGFYRKNKINVIFRNTVLLQKDCCIHKHTCATRKATLSNNN